MAKEVTIQPNEIRIGNWIYDFHVRRPFRVTNICQVGGHYFYSNSSQSVCIPISLTDDVFFKCGFIKMGMSYIRRELIVHELSDGKYAAGWGDMRISITFMHQLQNIFYILTGKELEEELTKPIME